MRKVIEICRLLAAAGTLAQDCRTGYVVMEGATMEAGAGCTATGQGSFVFGVIGAGSGLVCGPGCRAAEAGFVVKGGQLQLGTGYAGEEHVRPAQEGSLITNIDEAGGGPVTPAAEGLAHAAAAAAAEGAGGGPAAGPMHAAAADEGADVARAGQGPGAGPAAGIGGAAAGRAAEDGSIRQQCKRSR